MSAIAQILQTVIAPVFIVIAAGFLLQKFTSIDARAIANTVVYVFAPCLVFTSIIRSSSTANEWFQISLVAVASALALIGVSWVTSKSLGLNKMLTSAVILSTAFVNAGNYGLPLNLLAFGERGLELAIVFFVVSSLLSFTLAVFVASQGTRGFAQSLRNIARLPLIYALLLGFVVRSLAFDVPQPIFQSVNLMGQAAVPSMIIVLGTELAHSQLLHSEAVNWKLVSLSSAIKLLLPIVFVTLLSELIGLGGLARKVALVQASMPTAVITVILAVQFGGDSRFVTGAVIVSTLASIVTLTLLLSFLV